MSPAPRKAPKPAAKRARAAGVPQLLRDLLTARTPSSLVPFAAQWRDEPEPYSLPASTTRSMPSCMYRIAAS